MYQKFYAAYNLIGQIRESEGELQLNLTNIKYASFPFILEELRRNNKIQKVILQNWRFQEASRPMLEHLIVSNTEIYCVCTQIESETLFEYLLKYKNLSGLEISQKEMGNKKLEALTSWLDIAMPSDFRISIKSEIDQNLLTKLLSCAGIKSVKRLSLDKTRINSECAQLILSLLTSPDSMIEAVSLERCLTSNKEAHKLLGFLSKCEKAPDLVSIYLNGYHDLKSAPFQK